MSISSLTPGTRVRLVGQDAKFYQKREPEFFAHDCFVESVNTNGDARLVNSKGMVQTQISTRNLGVAPPSAGSLAADIGVDQLLRLARPQIGDTVVLHDVDKFNPGTTKFFQQSPVYVRGGSIGEQMVLENKHGETNRVHWSNLVLANATTFVEQMTPKVDAVSIEHREGTMWIGDVPLNIQNY